MVQILKINGQEIGRGRVTGVQLKVGQIFPLTHEDSRFHAQRMVSNPVYFSYGDFNGWGGEGPIVAVIIDGQSSIAIGEEVKEIEVQAQ